MKSGSARRNRRRGRSFLTGLVAGAILGLGLAGLDALVDVYVLKFEPLAVSVFRPTVHEIWMRVLVVIVAISSALLISMLRLTVRQLRTSEGRYRALADAAHDNIFTMDRRHRVQYVNAFATRLLRQPADELVGADLGALFPPSVAERLRGTLDRVFETGEPLYTEAKLPFPDHEEWQSTWIVPLRDDSGNIYAVTGISRDITDRKQVEQELRNARDHLERRVEERTAELTEMNQLLQREIGEHERAEESLRDSEERFRSLAQSAIEAIITCDGTGTITFWNKAAEDLFGYPTEEILGSPLASIMPERFRKAHLEAMRRTVSRGKPAAAGKTMETFGLHKDGTEFPLELSLGSWVVDDELNFTAIIRDIAERKRAEEIITHQAYHDGLTGLPNRALFYEYMSKELSFSRRYGETFGVLFFDLDGFKDVNDRLGHAVGDRLLQAVARRCRVFLRESETVARLGGDEFLILIRRLPDPDDAAIVARRVLEAMAAPFAVNGHTVQVTTSIGVALFPRDSKDGDELVTHADTAMYIAKRKGRNRFQFYYETGETERADFVPRSRRVA